MKFTLIFSTNESTDLSIGMIFVPCLVWTIGSKHFWNPHRNEPNYLSGDFQNLLKKMHETENLNQALSQRANQKIFVIVHDVGNGTSEDLTKLLDDIKLTGYTPVMCH